ncbi:MAG: thiolase family protein [Gammaproteobacteria bacterium]|nr:thiolase family protein [Gammaproteobacteria bacterium]
MNKRPGRRPAIVAPSQIAPGHFPEFDGLGLLERILEQFLQDWPSLTPDVIDGLLTPPTTINGANLNTFIYQRLAGKLGIRPKFAETLNAGASYGAMVSRAVMAIEAGICRAVLCVGVGKFPPPRSDAGLAMATLAAEPDFEFCHGASIPAMYALLAKRYIHLHGTTRDQLSAVAVNARQWALQNPEAFMYEKGPLCADDVVASRPIAEPFHKFDCSVPCEGGGAFLVATEEVAKELTDQPPYVVGLSEVHHHSLVSEMREPSETGIAESGRQAFGMSGLVPADINMALLYDAFTMVPIIEAEELGLAPRGGGGELFASGETGPGGAFPVNTFGGLLSFGHTGDAAGISFFVEAARQVMGIAGERQLSGIDNVLIHSYGGIIADHITVILSREP